MGSAAELRNQIESALAGRIPAALSFRPPAAPELLSCGLAEVDAVLGGGLPLGAITELTGPSSSGRTTLVLSALAGVTRQGESCAYVDASDALDPLSASALGVDLRRLLWVRTETPRTGTPCTETPRADGVRRAEADVPDTASPFPAPAPASENLGRGAGWCHPRKEVAGLPRAIGQLFHAEPERLDFTPRCSESIRRPRVLPVIFNPQAFAAKPIAHNALPHSRRQQTSWTRLDHALRATDLLLSAGGFRAIVLDMGDISPEQARRVPLATWYRFRLQAEKSRTLFLLMTGVACANSCAALSLHCRQGSIDWQQAELRSPLLLTGLRYRLRVERSRAAAPARKKPPAASVEALWNSATPWTG